MTPVLECFALYAGIILCIAAIIIGCVIATTPAPVHITDPHDPPLDYIDDPFGV